MMKKNILFIILIFIPVFSFSQMKYIVLDPGHQWDNTTSVLSPARTVTEVETNLAVAEKLKELISNSNFDIVSSWDVRLTREDNFPGTNVELWQRERIANNLYDGLFGNDEVYFLSIHCNAGGGTGTESFYCNESIEISNTEVINYAQSIQDNMVEFGQWKDRSGNRSGGVEECDTYFSDCNNASDNTPPCTECGGHLCVLNDLQMANCLNEIGFVDYLDDENKLKNELWRWKFARAYLNGFTQAFADLTLEGLAFEKVPCFASNDQSCTVSITVKNRSSEDFNGDIRVYLRNFPMYIYQEPISDFHQIDYDKLAYIPAGGEATFTFSSYDIPIVDHTGKALCIETRKSNEFYWKKVPCLENKDIIKMPLNGARVRGIIYDNSDIKLQGAEIWSYIYPESTDKSYFSTELYDIAKSSSEYYDPASAVSNVNGAYEILIPYDWEKAVISVLSDPNYDENLLAPIENNFYYHYYTTSPIRYGVGSGSGETDCNNIQGIDINNPIELLGKINDFDRITINDQIDIAIICKEDQIRFGVYPKPKLYTQLEHNYCSGDGSFLIYYSKIDAKLPYNIDKETNWTSPLWWLLYDMNYNYDYFISITRVDHNLNPIGDENGKWFNKEIEEYDLPILIGDIDVNDAINKLGVDLIEGEIYKLKVFDGNSLGGFYDYIYILPETILYNKKILDGQYYGRNINIENSKTNGEVNILASNEINIKPNTTIYNSFSGAIDKSLNNISCDNKLKSKTSDYEKYRKSVLNSINYVTSGLVLPNRTVSEFSDNCSCKDKKDLDTAEDLFNEGITIFPNPTSSDLIVNIFNNTQSKIEIFNLEGKLVEIIETQKNENIIDVSQYQEGIYILKISNLQKSIITKFVKE